MSRYVPDKETLLGTVQVYLFDESHSQPDRERSNRVSGQLTCIQVARSDQTRQLPLQYDPIQGHGR
jgi:hypothetical protein